MVLLVLGLAISIPLIVAGAALIMALLDRFPILVWAGAALLGWIVGEVIATDPVLHGYLVHTHGVPVHARSNTRPPPPAPCWCWSSAGCGGKPKAKATSSECASRPGYSRL